MLHRHDYRCITIERRVTGEHFIHDNAQSIHIGSRADNLSLGLLGRVVLHRSQGHPGRGEPFRIHIFKHTGNTEVGQFN